MITRACVRNRFSRCAAAASAGLAALAWTAPTSGLTASAFVVSGLEVPASARMQEQPPTECTVDLTRPGVMKDIVSNALRRRLKLPATDIKAFLAGAEKRYQTGTDLLKAAAVHFKINEDVLAAKVEKYKHTNCKHPVPAPALPADPHPHPDCTIDLARAGSMSDVLSNVLLLGQQVPEQDVRAFLDAADEKYEDGPELLKAAAVNFKISEDVLGAKVSEFKHINCKHGLGDGAAAPEVRQRDDGLPVPAFASDVTLHVVLHELGHALIREFDIPILGNEETAADAFATCYLTTYLPDRALDVLTARTTSLMIEAGESPQVDWRGEHDDDARRAYQIAALAVAADAEKYKPVAAIVGMSDDDIRKARDYGAEIHRSWRRVLGPLWMPDGSTSAEARIVCEDGSAFLKRLCEDGLAAELGSAIKRFDWHSQVTIRFVDGDGGAAWSRSGRTITVHSGYVRRFIEQGGRGLPGSH